MSPPRTPSQTVGPFFAIGLCRRSENELDPRRDRAGGAPARRRRGAGPRRRDRALGRRGPPLGPLRHRPGRALPLPRPARRGAPGGARLRTRAAAPPADAHLPAGGRGRRSPSPRRGEALALSWRGAKAMRSCSTSACRASARRSSSRRDVLRGDLRSGGAARGGLGRRLAGGDARRRAGARERGVARRHRPCRRGGRDRRGLRARPVRRGGALRGGPRGREPGRAARPRAPGAGRGAARALGALRGDQPGRRRHGGDARRPHGLRRSSAGSWTAPPRRARCSRRSTATRRWRRGRSFSRRCRRRSARRRRAGSSACSSRGRPPARVPASTAQLGGAAGTLAPLGERGLDVAAAFAGELDLAAPLLPWHAHRVAARRARGALDAVAQACAKVALDVVLLAQTEVGEVAEARGRRLLDDAAQAQPGAAVLARACAAARARERRRARGGRARARARRRRVAAGVDGALARRSPTRAGRRPRSASASRASRSTPERMRENMTPELYAERDRLGVDDAGVPRLGGRVRRPGARALPGARVTLAHRLDGPEDAPVLVLSARSGRRRELWEPQVPALRRARSASSATSTAATAARPRRRARTRSTELGPATRSHLLDELGVERASLLRPLARRHGRDVARRERARAARRASSSPAPRRASARPSAYASARELVRERGIEPVADAVVARVVHPRPSRRPERRRVSASSSSRSRAEGYAGCCEALAGWDFRDELPRVAVPTLVLAGAEDAATPAARHRPARRADPRRRGC